MFPSSVPGSCKRGDVFAPCHSARRRVVVTGMGVVSPVGCCLQSFWDSLLQGCCGIAPITLFDATGYPCPYAAEVKDFDPATVVEPKRVKTLSRMALFGMGSALEALRNARWEESPGDGECGVIGAVSNSAQEAIEDGIKALDSDGYQGTRRLWYTVAKSFPHSMASEIALRTSFQAKVFTIATVCTAGMNSLAYALKLIQQRECDAVLVSSSDAVITEKGFAYFARARMLANGDLPPEHISRPFDAKRSGGILGEGAGSILLESEEHAKRRKAPILCELMGAGSTGAAFGATEEAEMIAATASAITEAMAEAHVMPETIDYIGCHGVSSVELDKMETRAIKQAFGEDRARRIPMSSIKALTGIPQNAAGVLQTIATIKGMDAGVIPPTMNYEYPDPDCDLDYVPNRPRYNQIKRALVWCHGVNGSDSAVVLGDGNRP